jgi:glycosyltransferase involved in cell wall biosynthesis
VKKDADDRLAKATNGAAGKALMLVAHEPTKDPRIDWFAEGLAADFEVCEVGIFSHEAASTGPSLERLSARRMRVRVDGQRIQWDFARCVHDASAGASVGIDAMSRLFFMCQLPLGTLGKAIGALQATEEDLSRLSELCHYFIKVNSSLLNASRQIGGFDVIVAVDLETLPAAVALAEEHRVPVVYDAHEYWPYADFKFKDWEVRFWADLENTLLQCVTLPLTVSPQLADIMSLRYGREFDFIPNCVPLEWEKAIDLEATLEARARSDDVIFLVQGGFGAHRGVDKLINTWDKVNPRAKLWLRGPDGLAKTAMINLAQIRGVLNRCVYFPDAVSERELVKAAREADIGLVPYEPIGPNHCYCAPNKLSQYMAAGLPIICNELEFVKSVVVGNGIGVAVDFSDQAELVRTVNEYVQKRRSIPELSRRSREYFESTYNWQNASQRVYGNIRNTVSRQEPRKNGFEFSWINDIDYLRSNAELSRQGKLSEEIKRLNIVYMEEIKRLNEVIKLLNQEIASLKKITLGMAARYIWRRAKSLLSATKKSSWTDK